MLFIKSRAEVRRIMIKAKVKSATPKVLAVTRTAMKEQKVISSP
jgi:hypothetical protein